MLSTILLLSVVRLILSIEIRTSPNDPREYRFVKLKPNGLPTILISDKNADRSAAALRVAVGSYTDPSEYLGLAHYLEHILFLGSERYPATDDFASFIQKNGGKRNAGTENDHTIFYFDVMRIV